ncbi:hypothetical protein VNI00_014387 [Paramarasmius palmivorus]|uniref:Autophagy-related protein 14 n=1 Tax=Paramarasmius palmivorus TaxID=297713 RepID=A0AAW0BTF3_9AGAR
MTTPFVQRRIRHVTSIQVCNLSPFPLRDAFASAISKPTEKAQFVTHGHLPDDLDATLSRKRGRRISTNSITTLRSLHSDEGAGDTPSSPTEGRGRKRTMSSTSATRQAPTVRSQRVRNGSISSTLSHPFPSSSVSDSHEVSIETSKSLLATLPDNSQSGLEKVIKGRLVETFLSVYILPNSPEQETPVTHHSRSASASQPSSPLSPLQSSSTKSAQRKGLAVHPPSSPGPSDNFATSSRRGSWAGNRSIPSPSSSRGQNKLSPASVGITGHKTSASVSSLSEGLQANPESKNTLEATVPDYLSPIHRPSTNPLFFVDPRTEFAPNSDISGDRFRAEIWAKISEERRNATTVNGKGKEKEQPRDEDHGWQVLEQWDVDLSEVVPLADDLNATMHLPSNTLVVGIGATGQRFYIPRSLARNRSPSPSAGYASDPETVVHKVKVTDDEEPLVVSRRHRRGTKAESASNPVKTAGWQDLFKLVSLQTCIIDTQSSLRGIIDSINTSISESSILILKREISERQSRMAELRADCNTVTDKSQKLREDMRARREMLRHRQEMLALARVREDDEFQQRVETEEEVVDERARYESLRSLFRPTRATLISTLASIFPIELLSPPDLLYTILDVPLPIPLSSNDPAPPLSLPNHKDINEETVATALGYAALLVQLLAAYLGKGLVYPVTYIGSRSLIRDGISAMVGPRMFPLFSRGVDTYRFEYGVFLLNKNIELLMVEHDLRAMDMRHTLPNLKNLLLTLTDGENIPVAPKRPQLSPITSLSEFESPSLNSAPSSPKDDSTTPKANTNLDLPATESTPSESGSTTPTASAGNASDATDTIKLSRFLGLPPLSGFLRVRYPSSLLTTKGSEGGTPGGDSTTPENSNATTNGEVQPTSTSGDDLVACEDDRRTIRTNANGSDEPRHHHNEDAAGQESKSVNGNGNGHLMINLDSRPSNPAEKHFNNDRVSSLATPSLPNVAD